MRVAPARRVPPPRWLRDPILPRLFETVARGGGTLRLVGGAVRALVRGGVPDDLDCATDLRPVPLMRLLRRAGYRVIPTGLRHGTISVLIGRWRVEITTLRVDLRTDGRHACVAFTDDWRADARRRDLTVNALYADADGIVHDPVGGLADLRQGRVRFVGDPVRRIAEDRLRLLRFFRFHALLGRGPLDARAVAACAAAAGELHLLARERITAELLKLLVAPGVTPVLRAMAAAGVLDAVLAVPVDIDRCDRLCAAEKRFDRPDGIRRLAALLPRVPKVASIALARLALSQAQRDRVIALATRRIDHRDDRSRRRSIWLNGVQVSIDLALMAVADGEIDDAGESIRLARSWWPEPFPLGGGDVIARGVLPGPEVGRLLDAMRSWWIESDFRAGREACLRHLDSLVGTSRG